jgi:hypothetical protein
MSGLDRLPDLSRTSPKSPLAEISAASSDWQASCGSALVCKAARNGKTDMRTLVGLAIEADQPLW